MHNESSLFDGTSHLRLRHEQPQATPCLSFEGTAVASCRFSRDCCAVVRAVSARFCTNPVLTDTCCPTFLQIMRSKRARPRKRAKITNSRWVAYGIAGAATAVGATTAEAEIHYSGAVNVLVSFGEKTFPLSNGAILWFDHFQSNTDYTSAKFEVRSAPVSNGWQSDEPFPHQHVPENLTRRQPISTRDFGSGVGILATAPFCNGYEFCQQGLAFLGFKFNTGNGTQYGWVRLRMRGDDRPPKNAFHVVDYAWADVGERIRAGQTHSSSQEQAAVSPSGSLGLLALGAAGLELWRAQRPSSVTGK